MKTIFLILLVLFIAPLAKGQIIWELPREVRYDLDRAFVYVENKLKDQLLNEDERASLQCVLSQLYNKRGLFAQGSKVLLEIKKPTQFSAETQVSYFLARAINEKYRNEPEAANRHYDQAINEAKKLKDTLRYIEVCVEKAEYYRRFYMQERGLTLIDSAFQILNKLQRSKTEVMAYALNRRGALLDELGRGKEAVDASRSCIRLAKKVDNFYLMAASYNEIGFIYKNLLLLDSSYYYYSLAEENFRKGKMLLDATQAWFNRLEMLIHNGYKMEEAIPELKRFTEEYEKNDIQFPMRMAFLYLAEDAERKSDYKSATTYWKKYNDAVAKEFRIQSSMQLENLKQEYENEKVIEENRIINEELNEQKAEIERKDARILGAIIGLLLVLGGLFLTYRLYARTKRLTDKLKKQNEEKDVLVQEVHHRVKNNLHFIHSLLDMQKNASSNIEEAVGLEEASLRISCVSLVHEFLFQESNFDRVLVSKYLQELMQHLETTFMNNDNKVGVQMDIAEVEFSIQNCTAMGLLISELYTNSVKYAFPDHSDPCFSITFKKVNHFNSYELIVRDNGTKTVDFKKGSVKKTLGMRLIDIFSRQLKGDYDIGWENGFYYKLNFILDEG